jgi:hypothetical protein
MNHTCTALSPHEFFRNPLFLLITLHTHSLRDLNSTRGCYIICWLIDARERFSDIYAIRKKELTRPDSGTGLPKGTVGTSDRPAPRTST